MASPAHSRLHSSHNEPSQLQVCQLPIDVFIARPCRDVVLGLGPWLSLRTKPESLVLAQALNVESLVLVLRFMSLNKSLIVVFGFTKVNGHCTVISLLVRASQCRKTACWQLSLLV